jgi:glycosyltransferase involved in cell wall biosynthesis
MRIAIVTDAWKPQVNSVVTTLSETARCLTAAGHIVQLFTPLDFLRVPCPIYPEIRLSLLPGWRLARMLDEFAPQRVHIATEGPLGIAARRHCVSRRMPFTTSYHTQFPQYVRARLPIPTSWSYAFLRWFHGPSLRTLVATESMRRDMLDHGFGHVSVWSCGVDTDLFRPHDKNYLREERPILMYAGRVAVERDLEAFLELDTPGTKYVVGDGPALPALRRRYPHVVYAGYRFGDELAWHLAAADVFVFPSRTDTFGLVLLEALASGLPVAAYPEPGPLDIVDGTGVGVLNVDLAVAARQAIAISPERCREVALQYSWRASAEQFVHNLQPFC